MFCSLLVRVFYQVFSLRITMAITKRVFLSQIFEVFYIDLSGFDGLLFDSITSVEGNSCRFFGLGMVVNFLPVDIEGQDWIGNG
jgi:hypothetical protein